MSELTVREIEADESRQLRRSVLRPNLPPAAELPGDHDHDVVHLGAFSGSSLASACLVLPEPCPWQPGRRAWRLRSVATDPAARRAGAGTAVVVEAARIARMRSADVLWCQAREPVTEFYLRLGWQPYGDIFDTEHGPHLGMWLELSAS